MLRCLVIFRVSSWGGPAPRVQSPPGSSPYTRAVLGRLDDKASRPATRPVSQVPRCPFALSLSHQIASTSSSISTDRSTGRISRLAGGQSSSSFAAGDSVLTDTPTSRPARQRLRGTAEATRRVFGSRSDRRVEPDAARRRAGAHRPTPNRGGRSGMSTHSARNQTAVQVSSLSIGWMDHPGRALRLCLGRRRRPTME